MGERGDVNTYISMGKHTLAVPLELFALNRRRLCERLRPRAPRGVVLLQGSKDVHLHDTDVTLAFQQEANFHWAFGVDEPGFYGALDVATGRSYLFAPELNDTDGLYKVVSLPCRKLDTKFGVDFVRYVSEMKCVLKGLNTEVLLTLHGVNSKSGRTIEEVSFEGIGEFSVDNSILQQEMAECRVVKTPLELEVLRYVNRVSSEAHRLVMRKIQPGMHEYHAETMFLHHCQYAGGCRSCAYSPVCSSGPSSAVLHHAHAGAPNTRRIHDGDMLLLHMGAKYCGYVADITCSFPVNGRFTELQAAVYDSVLKARNAVLRAVKPGATWPDMLNLANSKMFASMKKYGILTGAVEDMMKAHLRRVFQPHGLGHLIGKHVHDVGQYVKHDSDTAAPQQLTARVLQAGMVISIEPACYFVDKLLDVALEDPEHSQFLVPAMIHSLRGFGGVRIEDNVVVTETGYEMLTDVPRDMKEIELFLRGKSVFRKGNSNSKSHDHETMDYYQIKEHNDF